MSTTITAERSFIFPINPDPDQEPNIEDMEMEIESLADLLRNRFHHARRIEQDLEEGLLGDGKGNYFIMARQRRVKVVAHAYYKACNAIEGFR